MYYFDNVKDKKRDTSSIRVFFSVAFGEGSLPEQNVSGAGPSVAGACAGESHNPFTPGAAADPTVDLGFENGLAGRGQTTAMHDENGTLAAADGVTHKIIEHLFGLISRKTVKVDMGLNRIFPTVKGPGGYGVDIVSETLTIFRGMGDDKSFPGAHESVHTSQRVAIVISLALTE